MLSIPFAFQWSIPEDRLLSLKDSNGGRFNSASVTNIPEFEYFLQICPNGDGDEHRGETGIYLYLKFGKVKKVEADFTFAVESADYSTYGQAIYEKSIALGYRFCKADEFFDPEKKYISDGKFTVKVNGVFKFESEDAPDLINEQKWFGGEMGDDLWQKDDTKDFTIITKDEMEIKTHKFILRTRSQVFAKLLDSDNYKIFKYYSFKVVEAALKLIYNCNFTTSLSSQELTLLHSFFLTYDLKTSMAKVELYLIDQISALTVCNLTNNSIVLHSSNLKEKCIEFLMGAIASKTPLNGIQKLDKDVALEILENSLYRYIQDIFAAGNEQQKWKGGELGDDSWKTNDTKDFLIIVDGKEIKAHKFILENRSEVFDAMLKSNMKETKENKMEITDFPFKVVESALQIIYNCNFVSSLSLEELLLLLQFFDKYNLLTFKAKVESLLIPQISASTVCRLTNGSIFTNSLKLKEKCMEFLSAAFSSKTVLNDIKILDKDIALKILEDYFYQIVDTEKV